MIWPGLASSSMSVRYSRRQQAYHRYLQVKHELAFNDEDEFDFILDEDETDSSIGHRPTPF